MCPRSANGFLNLYRVTDLTGEPLYLLVNFKCLQVSFSQLAQFQHWDWKPFANWPSRESKPLLHFTLTIHTVEPLRKPPTEKYYTAEPFDKTPKAKNTSEKNHLYDRIELPTPCTKNRIVEWSIYNPSHPPIFILLLAHLNTGFGSQPFHLQTSMSSETQT